MWPRSRPLHAAAAVAALALAACSSESVGELPPAAGPPSPPALLDGGRTLAVVSPRARVLELVDARSHRRLAREPAGVGPTRVACLERAWCYVVDTRGDALLVFRRSPRLELVRRYYLPSPLGIALDARRRFLYVTLPTRDELVQLPAHGRPHVARRWPTVRRPRAVAVDEASGRVAVTGDSGVQLVRP
jgi:hypothetical protein